MTSRAATALVEGHAVLVFHGATKDVQSTADGEMDPALASFLHGLKVGEGLGSTGVGDRDGGVGGNRLHESEVDAGLFALNIDGMDEKFRTVRGEFFKRGFVYGQLGEILPAVSDDPVLAVALTTGKVQHKAFAPDRFDKGSKPIFIQLAFAENPGSNNNMRGTRINPSGSVLLFDAATKLEPPGKGCQCLAGRSIVAGTKLDDMAAPKVILPVECGVPRGWPVRYKIGLRLFPITGKCTADNLLYLSFMQVNAGPKHKEENRRPRINFQCPKDD